VNKLASINRSLGLLLWCSLVVGIVLTSLDERRIDLWWQLAEGRQILQSHHLPTEAPAAFGLPHQPFIDEYTLYEICLALLEKLGGFSAIHAAFAATYLLIFTVPLATAKGIRRDFLSLVLVALAEIFLVNRYEQRPEIVGVLLLVLLIAALRRARTFSVLLTAQVALIFLLWTNVHSSYLIGLLALGIGLLERTFFGERATRWTLRQAALLLALACGALLVNPYGWPRIAFTFDQENDIGSDLLSREMWPAWDQPLNVMALMAFTALVLLLACLRRPRPARWLMGLAIALFILTLFHIRHMSFLAAALLYLYADRPVTESSPRRAPLQTIAFGTVAVALLLFDALAARDAYGTLAAGETERNGLFAPVLLSPSDHAAVLCQDAEGSYLEMQSSLIPLLDSGQMHFDDATKRFYFFTIQDPQAFDLALDDLPVVDAVIVSRPVPGWTLAMIHHPGWYLAGIDPNGLLFRRLKPNPGANPQPASLIQTSQIPLLAKLRDEARREDDPIRAFTLSALIDPPSVSLNLLDQSTVPSWSEAFFSFTRRWTQSLPPDVATTYLSAPRRHNPLLLELISARRPSGGILPPLPPTTLGRLARVLTLMDTDQASAIRALAVISPPKVSALYYTLRGQLDPESMVHASTAERWQDWNSGGVVLFQRTSASLNLRGAAWLTAPEPR
jgi:hypothetical protein